MMTPLRKLAEHRPFAFVIAVFVIQAAVAVPFVAVFKGLGLDIVPLRFIIPVAQSIVMVALVAALGWYAQAGFTGPVQNVRLLWYPTVLAFVPVMVHGTIAIPASGLLFYLGAVLFTGISEETFARGLVVSALRSRGKWVALLVSGALFSVAHFSNLMFENFGLLEMADVLLQTFGFAILYGALFLRTGSLWPLVLLHTLHDYLFVTSGSAGPYKAVPMPISLSAGLSLLNIVYGAYILRAVRSAPAAEPAEARSGGGKPVHM